MSMRRERNAIVSRHLQISPTPNNSNGRNATQQAARCINHQRWTTCGRMLWEMTQASICGPALWLTKKSTTSAGIVMMPSNAAPKYDMSRLASIRCPPNRSASTVPVQASPRATAMSVVFIETLNATPSKSPAVNARATVARPVTKTARTISQTAIQSSSGRYSIDLRKNGGKNVANRAVHSAIRGEKMDAVIFQTHQIVAAKRGIIASRIGSTMSARTPNRRNKGTLSAWKAGIWLSKMSR